MSMDGQALAAILAVVGGVVWLVRLEGRVNGHDIELRQARADLTYIRARIDEALDR